MGDTKWDLGSIPSAGCRRITIVSGGNNHIRDYVSEIFGGPAVPETTFANSGKIPQGNSVNPVSDAGHSRHEADPMERTTSVVTPNAPPQPVLLLARLQAIQKAISVAEIVKRCAFDRGLAMRSTTELTGMAAEG